MNWQYFIFGVIVYQILKMLALSINRAIIERREKKFLKLVTVVFPDRSQFTFISIDTSDKRAMAKLEREIRDQFDLTEDQAKKFLSGRKSPPSPTSGVADIRRPRRPK